MIDISRLHRHRTPDEVLLLLARASTLAKKRPELKWRDLQDTLQIGYGEANLILDWLADHHAAEPVISNHWIRCGRTYTLNNFFPTLVDMANMLDLGERRAFLVMHALEKRNIIRIRTDFSFERIGRMASFADLVHQMKVVANKYRGRCEPELLTRTMYIDWITAVRLAQYGEENLGLRWKNRSDRSVLR